MPELGLAILILGGLLLIDGERLEALSIRLRELYERLQN
jgi:hypothetical protein